MVDDNEKLIRYAKKNPDGFTVHLHNGKLTPVKADNKNRYVVAGKTSIIYIPKDRNTQFHTPVKKSGYYGGWYDKETGRYLIEESHLYSNRKRALRNARQGKQKAIFDLMQMKEIKLYYRHPEHITGMRIKKVSPRQMKDYTGLHGKLPKNELPKRFRRMPKKDVYIRSDLPKERQKEIIAHEREEIKLMDKGAKYKPAHRKANQILRERKHKPVVIKKGRRYYNRLSGKYVSYATACRLNQFFKEHPKATLYEANKGAIYIKDKSYGEQKRIHKIYERTHQVVKTKDKYGNDVYFSPILNKRISKKRMREAQKFDYTDSGFIIHCYRYTANRDRIYHIIIYPVKMLIRDDFDVDRMRYRFLTNEFISTCSKVIKRVVHEHPLGSRTYLKMQFDHVYYNPMKQKEAGKMHITSLRHPEHIPNQAIREGLKNAIQWYRGNLHNYTLFHIKKIDIHIYSTSSNAKQTAQIVSETRLGIRGQTQWHR